MTIKKWKFALPILAFAPLALTPGVVSSADAMGCCCGGKKMMQKGKASAGCMGGAAMKDGKAGMRCMAGMNMSGMGMKGMNIADMSTEQKSSDDKMMSGTDQSKGDMSGMDHSKMDMSGMDHSKMDMSGGNKQASDANPDIEFAKAMIEHHEGAIAMAKAQIKDGKNDELKKKAEDIVAAQTKEIRQLYEWLAKNAE